MPPETLLSWGLVDELRAPDALDAATLDFARRLAAQPRSRHAALHEDTERGRAGDIETAKRMRDEARRTTGRTGEG